LLRTSNCQRGSPALGIGHSSVFEQPRGCQIARLAGQLLLRLVGTRGCVPRRHEIRFCCDHPGRRRVKLRLRAIAHM